MEAGGGRTGQVLCKNVLAIYLHCLKNKLVRNQFLISKTKNPNEKLFFVFALKGFSSLVQDCFSPEMPAPYSF